MKNILIVDNSNCGHLLCGIYQRNGYVPLLSKNAFDAILKLNSLSFDLVVSAIELPGDNSFALYEYLKENYPFIPAIMISDREVDYYFNRIFKEGIGNVLAWPIDEHELLILSDKLINRENIFGLNNYMPGPLQSFRISITKSGQIASSIQLLYEKLIKGGYEVKNRMAFNLLLNEMTVNAVYHSHGLTAEKERRLPVTLTDSRVDIALALSASCYGVSITDYNGKLSREKILASINRALIQEEILLKSAETGEDVSDMISETGRGIDLLRKLAAEYYFIIRENFKTEIIIIFGRKHESSKHPRYSSLKIIEDYPSSDERGL